MVVSCLRSDFIILYRLCYKLRQCKPGSVYFYIASLAFKKKKSQVLGLLAKEITWACRRPVCTFASSQLWSLFVHGELGTVSLCWALCVSAEGIIGEGIQQFPSPHLRSVWGGASTTLHLGPAAIISPAFKLSLNTGQDLCGTGIWVTEACWDQLCWCWICINAEVPNKSWEKNANPRQLPPAWVPAWDLNQSLLYSL